MFDINEKLDAVLTAPLKATVFQYFMNFLPFVLSQFSPLFTFISVIFFTSRMADRSEVIAMLSNGISFHRLTVPYLFSAAVIALGSYLLAAYIIPPANVERIAYTNKWVKNKEVIYGDNIQLQVRPGVMAYMSRYDNTTRSGFRFSLEEFDGNTLKSRLTAETIKYDSVGLWTVRQYTIRNFDGMKETMTKGSVMDTLLNIDPRDFLISKNDEQTMTSPELIRYIQREEMRGTGTVKTARIELYQRLINPLAIIVMTLIGVAIAARKSRGGIGVHLAIGISIAFSFIVFMKITTVFATNGDLSPFMAVLLPQIIFSVAAAWLIYKAPK